MAGEEALPWWADRLRTERERRSWNKHEMARRLQKAAGVPYPPVTSLVRQILGWEKGEHFPRDWTAAYATAYGMTEEELFGHPPHLGLAGSGEGGAGSGWEVDATKRRDALRVGLAATVAPAALAAVLGESAAEAMEFTRLAGASSVGTGTFDHLQAAVAAIDRSYVTEPPAEVFAVARAYRVRVQELIRGPHTLKQGRELYVWAAWLSELLAWLAHDLGHPLTAEAYAIDSFEHADQAGHDELCAWAADALASIATYTDRPDRAVAAAHKGITRAPEGHPIAVRLRAKAARAHACLGQGAECADLLRGAEELHDRLPARPPTRFGTDTGPLADYAVTAYPASAYIWLEDYEQARRHAERAVAVHASTPSTDPSPGHVAIARIDLGIALCHLGAPDEAAAAGATALASPRVFESLRSRAGDLDAVLTARYTETGYARDFHERYIELRRASAARSA
ncbi:helix-turn-helix transcriptional regulator [Actinoallomurus sp. NPDC052274]|uniref:helix-turn-helix domain-containing protein n=1 Tax=Actinoallomurus sp. NPDC052274 TaxID=3155420 RepID=UPI003421013D